MSNPSGIGSQEEMSYKRIVSVHLAPVFCTELIYDDSLNKQISFQYTK